MDMRRNRTILLVATALAATMSWAQAPTQVRQQQIEADEKLIFFGNGDADTSAYARLISSYYIDQFRHSQDPRAPYFMMMSRNGKLAMGIGGDIEANVAYDWHGSIEGMDFAPYLIDVHPDHADVNRFQTYAGNTALFFTVFGNSDRFGNFKFYIEGEFSGDDDGKYLKLKKAYGTVGDWTLGYTKSSFSDPAAQPPTVETQGANACADDTRFLLRYMHDVGKHFTFALSAENPDNAVPDATTYYEPGPVYMPDFAGFVQWGWDGGDQHVRLMGMVKGIRYSNLYLEKNSYATGWGVDLSTVFRPVDPLTVYAAGYYGQGISSMVSDLSFGDLDLMAVRDRPGKMEPPHSFGWYAGLQYNYSPNVFSTVVVSQERILPRNRAAYSGDTYKYGLYGVANIFWDITPRCEVGAEIDLGKRCNQNGDHRMAYRASLVGTFSF
ncbi:MAG: hypothetical protein LIP03_08700 [Bacteroidales bacterium]|nr:hypothetical protein [Bacteroidales bacterium]